MTWSVFSTWKDDVNLPMSPAVKVSCPEIETFTSSKSESSICLLNLTCLRFNTISVTSSTIPLIVENSCSTPSIFIEDIAKPSIEFNKILLSALPTVIPYPGSSGLNSNCPRKSEDSNIITFSGFWKSKIAILFIF